MPKSAITVRGMDSALGTLTDIKEGWGEGTRWIVGVGAEYGAYVEFGTSRMQAQPYLFPAARKVMATQFRRLERMANSLKDLVALVANAIEAEAKDLAPVKSGNLKGSIEAAPAGAFRGA